MSQQRKNRSEQQPRGENGQSLRTLSHSLSWALRHAAPELGLEISSDGYVPVSDLLACPHQRFKGWTENDVRTVVETSDKQRYKLCTRTVGHNSEEVLFIRANQGHSIPNIDPHQLLTRVPPEELGSALLTIVHGTSLDAWTNHIQKEGLSRMTRNHIHFATGLPKDKEVISGMRKSCQVYIYADGDKCATHGIEFFQSANGVLLTAGVDNEGVLPMSFISHVTDASGQTLWTNNA
jgi:2'-phosphotransferase